jgi:ABC-type methionine transport system ATPase subunit
MNLRRKKTHPDKKLDDLTSKADKEINEFKSKSINQVQSIANDVTNELLNELSLKGVLDQNILTKKIEEISKKRIGDLN